MTNRKGITKISMLCDVPEEELATMDPAAQADMVNDAVNTFVNGLEELGFPLDVIATVLSHASYEFQQLDGTPPRIVRIPPALRASR
jgi:hypothetical protein